MRILFIAFIILAPGCYAQIPETREQFVNAVRHVIVNNPDAGYYLLHDCRPLSLHGSDVVPGRALNSGKFLPDSVIYQLNTYAASDTSAATWNCGALVHVRCISRDSIRFIIDPANGLRGQDHTVYTFSRPVFDNKREYAMIRMSYICGNLCGKGCLYIFKKENGIWRYLAESDCWIS
jgi:hypothetical protein